MTVDDFNKKYNDFLEEGHYGLSIDDTEFIKWLDERFEIFTKKPGFSFSQIKTKFGFGRFYCKGIEIEEIKEVEDKISKF